MIWHRPDEVKGMGAVSEKPQEPNYDSLVTES